MMKTIMTYEWKASVWIGVLEKCTQRPRQLTNNIQNGGYFSVNYYKFVSLFSPIQISLAQLFHVLYRQKAKPYLSVFKRAGLRPRRQWVVQKLIWKYSGTAAQRRTKRPAECVRYITRFRLLRFFSIYFTTTGWRKSLVSSIVISRLHSAGVINN